MSSFYLTTAIDYVNSRPHLGTAYEKVTADVIARYKRLCGVETRFLMGNDEHSQNVYQRAKERGLPPLVFCDQMEEAFRQVWRRLGISFDDFIRTTEERHRRAVTKFVQRISDAGDLYEGHYEGWYCVSCEAFKPEKDLVEGNCPIHLKPPQWIKERNHFFRLSKYQQPLLDHYAAHPEFLKPDIRRNEIQRFLEAGPEDISISRTGQAWGIPLPSDPKSVVYVWVDALINYISGVGYGTDDALFERWWPADLHIIGKDITRFHCVIWPAMLMSAGVALPRQVYGHGWVHWRGQKMSKSLGTVLDPLEAADRLGPDPLRLYLTKEIVFGKDGDFTWERFEERYNVDLANNLGNLVSRITSMAHRYRNGRLTPPAVLPGPLAATAESVVGRYRQAMDGLALHQGMAAVFDLIDATNEFIARSEPWAIAKDPARAVDLDGQLYEICEAVRVAAVLLLPVMPVSCAEILRRMGERRDATALRLPADSAWMTVGDRLVVRGDPLWPRLEAAAEPTTSIPVEIKEPTTMESSKQPPELPGSQPVELASTSQRISYDEFMKVELRTGRIVGAEAVPKSRKLLKIRLETGAGERQVVAGIAKQYDPGVLVGLTVIFVANLEPATLMGIESNGMILAATAPDGRPVLLTVDDAEATPPGSTVR